MPTWICRTMLIVCAVGLTLGAFFLQEWLILCSLCLVLWVGYVWIQFNFALLRSPANGCYFLRHIDGKLRSKYSIVLGNSMAIEVQAQFASAYSVLRMDVEHALPGECELLQDSPSMSLNPIANERYRFGFKVKPRVLGKTTLPGYTLKFSDAHGLFQRKYFFPQPVELTVLPVVMRSESTVSTTKKHNVQLFAGHHRYRRPGLGTEILGIRDYQSGDPPRSIAWKATARFNKLMTCEYESEVPVRTNIICDLSSYQFLGRPNMASADHVINATSSLANLLLNDRDPTSAAIFSESGMTKIRAGVGNMQLNRIVEMMLTWEPGTINPLVCEIAHAVDHVWQNCSMRFPELFENHVNRAPERNPLQKMIGGLASVFFLGRGSHKDDPDDVTRGKRAQLAYIFGALFTLEPGNVARLKHDDDYFLSVCQRYQQEYPFAINRSMGIADLASMHELQLASANNLCKLLLESSRRASDNELFLIVGVQPTYPDQIEKIENVVKVLCGAHHRVLFVSVANLGSQLRWMDETAAAMFADEKILDADQSFHEFKNRIFPYGAKAVFMNSPHMDQRLAAELEILKFGRHRVGK